MRQEERDTYAVRVVQVNPDENANFVFTNTPKPALRLIKTSSDGSRLAGVHFRIAKIEDGSHYLDRITDVNGEINISDLEPGIYSVKETATVSDHILDSREYHVELFPGQTSTITIENQVRPNLTVYKHDADTGEPVPNTVFLVRAADGHSVDEIKTDAEGKATLTNLLPGVYEVSEKSVPAPWLNDSDPQLVILYPNRDHTVYFENHKKPTLTVNKVDSITGSPIKGAKFQVWYGSNNTSTGEMNSLGVFFSDANGQFFIDLLRDGWYKVTELEPAPGFTIKEPATQEVYINPVAPYGYQRDPDDKHKLIPDPKTADIVRRIFTLVAGGASTTDVARILNAEGVPTPSREKAGTPSAHANWTGNYWRPQTVHWIIRDRQYICSTVFGKRIRNQIGVHRQVTTDLKDWVVVDDRHEPLVTKALFQLAQERLGGDLKQTAGYVKSDNPLSRKVYCGVCGYAIVRRGKTKPYYSIAPFLFLYRPPTDGT